MTKNIRKPQVSGRFYPSESTEIHSLINHMSEGEMSKINFSLSEKNILGAVLPHAGHIYSGYQTIHFFEILKLSGQVFDTWIVIHPLHQGGDMDYAAEYSDYWNTPLGNVRVDKEFIDAMQIPVNTELHRYEHSSEVILPFIQKYCENDFSYVSIGMVKQNPVIAQEISKAIAKAKSLINKRICIIASSDFSHYVSPDSGREMDQKVLECIYKRDVKGIYDAVIENDLSVCGYGPIMTLIYTLEKLYPDFWPVVLSRGHSGEVHPSSNVVDYISILLYS